MMAQHGKLHGKSILIILFLFLAFSLEAQNANEQKPKIDSAALQQQREQLFWKQRGDSLTAKDFLQWNYKNSTPEKYDQLIQAYNAFIQEQYAAWLKGQKK